MQPRLDTVKSRFFYLQLLQGNVELVHWVKDPFQVMKDPCPSGLLLSSVQVPLLMKHPIIYKVI